MVLSLTIQLNINHLFYTQVKVQTGLFQTIQLTNVKQVLPLRAIVDLKTMAIKGYSAFSKSGASPSDCLVSYRRHTLGCRDAVDVFYGSGRRVEREREREGGRKGGKEG